ncbi:MAG: Ig-like domain-containing protein [Magnetococcales bacterium]|nr:Ig-like domain-containing protein [Magnetococcales bacterium]
MKILNTLMALLLVVVLAACGGSGESQDSGSGDSSTSTTATGTGTLNGSVITGVQYYGSGGSLSSGNPTTDSNGDFSYTYTVGESTQVTFHVGNVVLGTATIPPASTADITAFNLVGNAADADDRAINIMRFLNMSEINDSSDDDVINISSQALSDLSGITEINLSNISDTDFTTSLDTALNGVLTGYDGTDDITTADSVESGLYATMALVEAGVMGGMTIVANGDPVQVNDDYILTVTVTVTDTAGEPLEGGAVVLSTGVGTLSSSVVQTDENGQAIAVVTYPSTADEPMVTASFGGTSSSINTTTTDDGETASSIAILVSSIQLNSSGADSVSVTAIVKDASNNLIENLAVSFSSSDSDSEIQVTQATTDSSGIASALLTTQGSPKNRDITVTATSGSVSASTTVSVSGTTLTFTPNSASMVYGDSTTFTISLKDSDNNAITGQTVSVTSAHGNTIDTDPDTSGTQSDTLTTDVNGEVSIAVIAIVSDYDDDSDGEDDPDVITATSYSGTLSGTAEVSISGDEFVFDIPDAEATSIVEVDLNTDYTVQVHWKHDNDDGQGLVAQSGQTINFSATRGTLSANSATTNSNGEASVTISADNAGPAIIQAVAESTDGPSTQAEIEFVATTPYTLVLQADPSSLGVNLDDSTDEQSELIAVVRDVENNLVKNQTVNFSVTDITGGSLDPPSDTTDSFGRASSVYTAGPVASAYEGIAVTASVPDYASATDSINLTVAEKPLFITLGTGNTMSEYDDTRYAMPYSVLVTDAEGNPMNGVELDIAILPTKYGKGTRTWGTVAWYTPSADCDNEDLNGNGILDEGEDTEDLNDNGVLDANEDYNSNGTLEPGNVASLEGSAATVSTGDDGFATFNILYAQEYAYWVIVELTARGTVQGTEDQESVTFYLPGTADDFGDVDVTPPGVTSPFGTASSCADAD